MEIKMEDSDSPEEVGGEVLQGEVLETMEEITLENKGKEGEEIMIVVAIEKVGAVAMDSEEEGEASVTVKAGVVVSEKVEEGEVSGEAEEEEEVEEVSGEGKVSGEAEEEEAEEVLGEVLGEAEGEEMGTALEEIAVGLEAVVVAAAVSVGHATETTPI